MFSPRGLQSVLLPLVLLGLGRHDVEASEGKQVIHKSVGDSVEFSSSLPAEGVTRADWKYGNLLVATKGSGLTATNPFKGRSEFNKTSLSLTIRDLTLQDSGEFSFSSTTDIQRPIIFFILHVHEPISTNSIVFFNVSVAGPDGFCTVFLECNANPHKNVAYSWTVGTQTRNGSRLQYTLRPQDGDTKFTCRAANVVSEKLTSQTLRCSNTTETRSDDGCGFSPIMFWLRLVVGLLVILVLVWLLCDTQLKEVFCSRFKHAAAVDQDASQLDLSSSPPPGDALVYENSGGAEDAREDENVSPL